MPSALLTRAARALRGALLGFLLAFAVRLALLRRLREKYNQWCARPVAGGLQPRRGAAGGARKPLTAHAGTPGPPAACCWAITAS
jgi:hypothetical protein